MLLMRKKQKQRLNLSSEISLSYKLTLPNQVTTLLNVSYVLSPFFLLLTPLMLAPLDKTEKYIPP